MACQIAPLAYLLLGRAGKAQHTLHNMLSEA